MMKQIALIILALSLLLLLHSTKSEENLVRDSLLIFLSKLSNNNSISAPAPGWNASSDPCADSWRGVTCESQHVRAIDLHSLRLQGVFDPATLCNSQSLSLTLSALTLSSNSLRIANFAALANCSALTVFLSQHNNFSGQIPDLLNFSSFEQFNLSTNNLSGQIPAGAAGLPPSSFLDNPELCGAPLPIKCSWMADSESSPVSTPPPPPPPPDHKRSGISNDQILMYMGYVAIAFVVVLLFLLWLRKKSRRQREDKAEDSDHGMIKTSFSTVELKGNGEYCLSAESGQMSTSLVVLTSPEVNGMRFEDLLKAPAELVGRGCHGSVYKVVYEEKGMALPLAVKRIKDWQISSGEFRQRMRRLNQVKHPTVMPALAYYSSGQEKLIVYEFQHNGSLFNHIHANSNGNGSRQAMEWSSRLSIAATVADALAYMHDELQYDRIPHGNLKSSNILFNKNMDPSISEYGLMLVQGEGPRGGGGILANGALQEAQEDYKAIFKEDSYAFGVILLELLTGRMVLTEGLDLASWVVAAVREEWTVEVFDKDLMREGVSEERMVNLLQIAIRCVAKPPGARPSMRQVALALGAIREEDERSLDVSDLSVTRSFVGL